MKLLIVIPAFNEERLIAQVLSSIPKKISGFNYISKIIINDGSSDNIKVIAHKLKTPIITHIINRGLGAALATGFEYARNENYDVLVTFDADGQHEGKDIERLIKPILQKEADVVIGSRLLSNSPMPLTRKIINKTSNILTFILFAVWTTDSQSGLRVFNKLAINKIRLKSQRMEVSSEIFKEISRLKLRLSEIPINSIYTSYSLGKGQKITNAPNVFWKLLLHRFS